MSETQTKVRTGPATPAQRIEAVIVGAGFAGMYMLHRLRGLGLSARVFEAGSGVGGTWYWNRYPGARCDVESMQYSYSFSPELQQEWQWSERSPPSRRSCAMPTTSPTGFDLRRDIQFDTRVTGGAVRRGDASLDGRAPTAATGSSARLLRDGDRLPFHRPACRTSRASSSFGGKTYHTGHWPHEGVDFTRPARRRDRHRAPRRSRRSR